MLRNVLLASAALALVVTAANARPQVTLSHDNRTVSVSPGKALINPLFDAKKKKAKYLSTTIASNADGAYFCCFGSTLSGPSSIFGAAYGAAEQFTLKKSGSATSLSAAVGYVSGDDSVTLTLYADNGSNAPGTMLAQGTATTSTEFGACCGITSAKISSTSLKAGTPYWVAVTTTGSNFEAAPYQVYNEVNNPLYVAYSTNGGSTWTSGGQATVEDIAIGVGGK